MATEWHSTSVVNALIGGQVFCHAQSGHACMGQSALRHSDNKKCDVIGTGTINIKKYVNDV